MDKTVNPFLSQKFRFWSFVSMFLLVFVHGYNLEFRYLQPWSTPMEAMTPTAFLEYLLANGLFRFRIPMLFIISGFLFAMHDEQPHGQRVKKRLRTLGLPYLLWSALGIALTFALEFHPYTRAIIADSHVVQIDDSRLLLTDYRWYELMFRWIFLPVPYQLWFIRVLLIYNLAYPWIRSAVMGKISRPIFFAIVILLWMGTMGFLLFEGEGLLFFSLGVWMQKTGFSIEQPRGWMNPRAWFAAFLVMAVAKTWLAFEGQALMGRSVFPLIASLHKGTVLSGLIAAWYGGDSLVRWFMERKWFVWLSAFSFMIYALHAPFVAYFINPVVHLFQPFEAARLAAFVFLPLVVIAICVSVGALLRTLLPKTYSLLTGGRGF